VNDIIFRSILTQFGQGSTYINFNTLGHTLADLHIVLAAHVLLNVSSQVVTGNADGVVGYDTAQRDNGNFSRTTTYIYNHVSFRSFHVDTDTDSGSHRFEYQVNVASAGMLGRVAHGTQFHFRTTRRDTDYHTERRRKQTATVVHHLYQTAYHLLASIEVGNYTVAERTDGTYVFVGLFVHHLCLITHGNHLIGTTVEGYHRRFIHHNLTIGCDDGIGGTKVHRYFLRKRE